jgi:hypothetical protein
MKQINWQEVCGFLNQYLDEISSMVLVVLTRDFRIRYCNQGFLKLLDLSQKPLGRDITDFFLPEKQQFPALPEVGGSLRVLLPFQPHNAAAHLLLCQIINAGRYYLVIGERLLQMESTIVGQISQLNQELTNIARELQQKNQALLEAMEAQCRSEAAKEELIGRLQDALQQVKTLSGLLPICSSCKKIRNDKGYWQKLEGYIREHSEAEFTHSICPECMEKLYGDFLKNKTR